MILLIGICLLLSWILILIGIPWYGVLFLWALWAMFIWTGGAGSP